MLARHRVFAMVLCFAIAGCQSSTTPAAGRAAASHPTVTLTGASPSGDLSNAASAEADDCATRMQDLGFLFLNYWRLNKQLPRSLLDLRSIADPVTELKLSCPGSTEPFVHVPGGLRAPGRSKAIFVYDPHLSKEGKRLCLLAEDPRPGAPWSVEVLAVPQSIFTLYRPISN